MSLFPDHSGAIFSSCMKYRFELWRQWDEGKPYALFVMLNPSTADEIDNDPTVERCQRRALGMGYGGVRVVNIFAFRSTDPQGLYTEDDPVGAGNDEAIVRLATGAGIVICAWGTHGNHLDRGKHVLAMLHGAGVPPHCLQLNADGTPKHPLYVGYDVQPVPM